MTIRQLWVQAQEYNAIDDRTLLAALLPIGTFGPIGSATGLRAASDFMLTMTTATAGTVSRGAAFVSAANSIYCVVNDADVPIVIGPSDPTLGRIDIVILQVNDSEVSGSGNEPEIKVIAGVPSAAPVAPARPAGSLLLNTLTIAAASSAPSNVRNATTVVPPPVDPAYGLRLVRSTSGNLATTGWQNMAFTSADLRRGSMTHDSTAIVLPADAPTGIYQITGNLELSAPPSSTVSAIVPTMNGGRQLLPGASMTLHGAIRPMLSFSGYYGLGPNTRIGLQVYNTLAGVAFTNCQLTCYLYSAGTL